MTKRYYYVYYSYEEWGRGYIGRRGCNCLPEEDTEYFGSFTDKTFKPTQKIILQVFDTLKDAAEAEFILHSFYKVDVNPHFANKARATSKKFYFNHAGRTLSEDHKRKIKEKLIGTRSGVNNPFYGKKHDKETIEKIRRGSLGRVFSAESRKKKSERMSGKNNPMYGLKKEKNPCFNRPRPEEVKKKISNSKIGKRLYTNGAISTFSYKSPGPDFWLKSKKP